MMRWGIARVNPRLDTRPGITVFISQKGQAEVLRAGAGIRTRTRGVLSPRRGSLTPPTPTPGAAAAHLATGSSPPLPPQPAGAVTSEPAPSRRRDVAPPRAGPPSRPT